VIRLHRLLGVAAAALVASALGACAGDGPFAITATGTRELSADAPTSGVDLAVQVEMFNGPIEVRAGAPGRVVARVTTTGAAGSKDDAEADRLKIQVTLDASPDGSVRLKAVYQPNPTSPNNRTASAVVEVPPAAALDLRTSNGRVDVTGIGGAIEVHTSNGAVRLAGATAGALVRTSNKEVEIDGAGTLDVETSNAAILLGGTGVTVRAVTSNATIGFDGALSDEASSMRTSNENIYLFLPTGASFSLDASTSNAGITLDGFTIETTDPLGGDTLRGQVGTGGPSITLRTSNKVIEVRAR